MFEEAKSSADGAMLAVRGRDTPARATVGRHVEIPVVDTHLVGDDGGFTVDRGTSAPLHGARGAPFGFAV